MEAREPHHHHLQHHQQPLPPPQLQRPRSHTVTTTSSSFTVNFSATSSALAYDRDFLRTLPGILMVLETVLGLLVWSLIAGTEYFLYPVFGWVMFVAVFYWVLTLFFLIIYMTMTYTRIPQVPWTTVNHLQSPKIWTATTTTAGQLHRSLPLLSHSAMLEIPILVLYLGDHGLCNKYSLEINKKNM
ncbi:CKLF-like MARVEL transmembrane domain-containing protein 8 isoform X2 [Heteronotia binoei]|uniref:CKLF-like MARVEL transmembrane domain-containing protein 8 isoform X2 n=1 Tax=Heteronotia binoei TaxID=13085 RepID=UPI00292DF10A|nr:CKLF-like MARVEL transmembrane domain-containing protein 8 isoform X2 [Heteronotia binoei]